MLKIWIKKFLTKSPNVDIVKLANKAGFHIVSRDLLEDPIRTIEDEIQINLKLIPSKVDARLLIAAEVINNLLNKKTKKGKK